MAVAVTPGRRRSALSHWTVSITVGVLVFALVAWTVSLPMGLLTGIVAMTGLFDVVSASRIWPMTPERTQADARREDFRPLVEETVIVTQAVVCLVMIIVVLSLHRKDEQAPAAALALVGIFLSWAMLHLMYTVRYAHMYYRDPIGGIDFNNDELPRYQDFLYFSYDLGMTYQVSDTNVSTTEIRSVVLRHTLLSYVFGTVILAGTINLVASLASS